MLRISRPSYSYQLGDFKHELHTFRMKTLILHLLVPTKQLPVHLKAVNLEPFQPSLTVLSLSFSGEEIKIKVVDFGNAIHWVHREVQQTAVMIIVHNC